MADKTMKCPKCGHKMDMGGKCKECGYKDKAGKPAVVVAVAVKGKARPVRKPPIPKGKKKRWDSGKELDY